MSIASAQTASLDRANAASRPAPMARHSLLVRATHWISVVSFLALLVTGAEIVVSHPRFYWGETGNILTEPLFRLPIPSSRALVPTGFGYVLPDQNGWSRALHFQSAWLLVAVGVVYVTAGALNGHFRKALFPGRSDLAWRSIAGIVVHHLRFRKPAAAEASSYNVLQRLTYLLVIFALFPLVIWTGLAMSPAFTAAFPSTVVLLGGRQSARTIHFIVSVLLVLFL